MAMTLSVSSSLYRIADVMQVTLEVNGDSIKGGAIRTYTALGSPFPVPVEALAMFYSDAVGVVFHICGDLYAVVTHVPITGAVTALLIDGHKLQLCNGNSDPCVYVRKNSTLPEVVRILKGGVVASFLWQNKAWKPLKLPDQL